eukprot:224314-Pyramimonas_sp.AAC.1
MALRRHRRGSELAPVVFEAKGRPPEEAAAFVRHCGSGLEDEERSKLFGSLGPPLAGDLSSSRAAL